MSHPDHHATTGELTMDDHDCNEAECCNGVIPDETCGHCPCCREADVDGYGWDEER